MAFTILGGSACRGRSRWEGVWPRSGPWPEMLAPGVQWEAQGESCS